jgi:hypothetical protein
MERRMDIGGVSSLIVTNNTSGSNSPYRYELTGPAPLLQQRITKITGMSLDFHYAGKDQVKMVGEKDLEADTTAQEK